MPEPDEFYVGYQPRAPGGLARFIATRVAMLLAICVGIGAVLVASQQGFSKAVFEFGGIRKFEGWIETTPYPQLVLPRPAQTGETAPMSRYLLVGFGKSGAGPQVEDLDGHRVRLEGTLIYHENTTMIELLDGSIESLGREFPRTLMNEPPVFDAGPGTPGESLGQHSFVGEIVDSKCYLGVMKPGHLKPHRACAARCISGGVPPVLLVRDLEGSASYLLLADADGRAVNSRVQDLVAEPVRIRGEVRRFDDLLVLFADPDTYERVDPGA